MKKSRSIEIIRTNEEPSAVDGTRFFHLTNACADGAGGVAEFERALAADLRDVSARIPKTVDPRVLLVVGSGSDYVMIRVLAPYRTAQDMNFWLRVKPGRCNALASRWFREKVASKGAGRSVS